MIVFSVFAILIVGFMTIAFSLLGLLDVQRNPRKSMGFTAQRF